MDQPQLQTQVQRYSLGRSNRARHAACLAADDHYQPHEKIKLSKRRQRGDYIEPDYPFRRIPAKY
jgi:hypothetical protein